MVSTNVMNPFEAVYLVTILTGLALGVLLILYSILCTTRVRTTSVYLSGESEGVVSQITPSIASLYWGFIKRFARSLYRSLVEEIHTGSLQDWFKFISSWFSILLILAIIAYLLTVVLR